MWRGYNFKTGNFIMTDLHVSWEEYRIKTENLAKQSSGRLAI